MVGIQPVRGVKSNRHETYGGAVFISSVICIDVLHFRRRTSLACRKCGAERARLAIYRG